MGAFDDLIPRSGASSGGTFDDLIPKQKTQADYQREVLAEMPWAQRQLVGAGGALMKGYEGIRSMLPGQTADQDVTAAADVAGQEAPIGSMVGEIAKYAPVALAGTAILPAAAASAALGAAYDPTGHRMSSAALEGVFGAGGALVGKALPRVMGGTQNLINKVRDRLSGGATDRFYGAADKASDAVKRIIGGVDNEVAASRMLGEAGDVTTAQALDGLPNSGGISVLDKITRSDKGIRAADDPIAVASERAAQILRQRGGRNEVMERMARGSTAEDTAIARDLFSKMSAAELVPIRDSILNKIKQTGLTLDELVPQLQGVERQYVSALQNQGRMATEAAQQGVLRQGSRATERQVVNALPEGNFPRETSMPVSPAGTPSAAQMSVAPFVQRGSQADYAARAAEATGAADELGGIAATARTEADTLRQQISELPSAFTAAPVRDAVGSMAAGLNATKRNVASKLAEELRIAGDDPVKIAELRAMTINTLIPDLVDGSNAQKAAAAALTDIKKVIDKQLGPEFVSRYLEPYSKKLEFRSSLELADTLRQLQVDSPKTFLKVMRGNDPDLVAKYGNWETIKQALGEKRFDRASKVAGEIQRDINIKEAAKSKEYGAAVKEVLENKSLTKHLPNLLNRYVALGNAAIDRGEMEVNKLMYRELEQAMRNPSKMKELIDRLPPQERSQFINYAMKLGKTGGVVGAAAGEQVRK